MSKKEQVCMYCNKEKGVIVDSWTFICYCAKCLWKQQEKMNDKSKTARSHLQETESRRARGADGEV